MAVTFERKQIHVGAVRASYLERGHATADAPTIVMLHGICAASDSFEPVVAELPDELHVLALDMPLLDAERAGDVSMDGFTAGLATLLAALGVERPIVLGHSHGGMVAMRLAGRLPLAGLVLMCPAHPFSGEERKVIEFYLSPIGRMFAHMLPRMPRRWQMYGLKRVMATGSALTPDRADSFIRTVRRPWLVTPTLRMLTTWWQDMEALRTALETAPLALPALILWGAKDIVVPPQTAPSLLAHFAQAEYVELPGAGHLPNEEAPAECAAAIVAWMERHYDVGLRPNSAPSQSVIAARS